MITSSVLGKTSSQILTVVSDEKIPVSTVLQVPVKTKSISVTYLEVFRWHFCLVLESSTTCVSGAVGEINATAEAPLLFPRRWHGSAQASTWLQVPRLEQCGSHPTQLAKHSVCLQGKKDIRTLSCMFSVI